MSSKNKYSATVLLPKTDFPMRAGLVQKEPTLLEFWDKMDIYGKMQTVREGHKKFLLHDGPPYANGHIHIGTALDKILKDMMIKSYAMMGYQAPYIPGWDCHGLPIENGLMKELKISKKDVTPASIPELRKKAREYAERFVQIQMSEFRRLGVLGDWDNRYETMKPHYEGVIIGTFLDLFEKGYIYKGKKTITWCPTCETALADAEIEYKDKTSLSIYLKFKLAAPLNGKDASLVVWTTTPWTIPANKAAAVAKDETYVIAEDTDKKEYLVLAEKLFDSFKDISGLNLKAADKISGEELVGKKYFHPLTKAENPVIWTDFVAMDTGVGIVHIAPGHGEDDFNAGLVWQLDTFCPVDERGIFTKEAGEWAGQHIFEANAKIAAKLGELGSLIKEENITHSYPHCWRCKQPIIFRATEQWFLGIDKHGLRGKLTENLEKTTFYPASGIERIGSMVKNRPDWCVSRQRFWGTPIPMAHCKECGTLLTDTRFFSAVRERALKEGSDFWFADSIENIVPAGVKCAKCGSSEFIKETDILDVWLDAGVSWRAVMEPRGEYPADVYSEGSDQHRGWFQTSLIPSVALNGIAPFKKITTHGFVLDHYGHAMHKSAGNSVSPDDVSDKYGAEILRLWVGMADYHDDIRISDEILQGPVDSYRKLRNTIRYAMGNLFDYNPKEHKVAVKDLTEMDRYMLGKLDNLIKDVRAAYTDFEYRRAVRAILDFCILDLSSFMLDASKDRLYTLGATAPSRRSAQTALAEILETLLLLMSPVLAFTSEEAWQVLKKIPAGAGYTESIYLTDFPAGSSVAMDKDLAAKWDKLRSVRDILLKALEEARQKGLIGSSLEAKVTVKASKEDKEFLSQNKEILEEIVIISKVTVEDGEKTEVLVEHADGAKCPRCWQWRTDIGSNSKYSDLCGRCADVLERENIEVND
ncbi:isoleucyl-tRNA synthetase [Parelusimicrobium proximum]|uniref:isoleucine--tRNA ligase n=1 Tax=Parelusimicrobium proximum TaxID=3228953 RepID=UPI003D1624E5